jgi:hypothetical protein
MERDGALRLLGAMSETGFARLQANAGRSPKRKRPAGVAILCLCFEYGHATNLWRRFGHAVSSAHGTGVSRFGGRSGRPPSGGPVRSDRKDTRSSRFTWPVGPRSITGRTILS